MTLRGNRIVCRSGTWLVEVIRGTRIATLQHARGVRTGMSGPLASGILRSKATLAIKELLAELYPNAPHHSDAVVGEDISVMFKKPGPPEEETVDLDSSGYAKLIGDEETAP